MQNRKYIEIEKAKLDLRCNNEKGQNIELSAVTMATRLTHAVINSTQRFLVCSWPEYVSCTKKGSFIVQKSY